MKFFCLNGMPRSGSTLLANILNQNPAIRATPTSGLCELLLRTSDAWNQIPEIRASATHDDKLNVLRGILGGFHFSSADKIVIDKSRGWVCAFELLENILGHKPKLLVTYRDIPSILSSCEKLFRKELSNPASVSRFGQDMETIEGRLAFWTQPNQLVGGAFNRIRDCVRRGHRQQMHFIDFDELTSCPGGVMREVYDFLGLSYFEEHDFSNVKQATHENDVEHGFSPGALHQIRPAIEPVKKDYREILGDAVKPYVGIDYSFIV